MRHNGLSRRGFLNTAGKGALALGVLGLSRDVRRTPWPPPAAAEGEDFWRLVRSQFPLTHERAYFNCGGLGPAPYPVLDTVQRTMMERQFESEHGHHLAMEVRPKIAAFIGANASEIAYMRNATEANATVASGLNLKRGDEVIFESHAHPGGLVPSYNFV